jgi:hypothetical protein
MNIEAFWGALTGTGFVALVFGFWVKYYFGPYLERKATNLATHEDIQLLINQVRETERVKADISDRVWDRQQRWAYKRDVYRQLLETLANVHEQQMFVLFDEKAREKGKATTPEHVAHREQLRSFLLQFRRLGMIAAVVIDADGYKILREVTDEDEGDGQAAVDFYDDALERLMVAARRDLGYGVERGGSERYPSQTC